MKDSRFAAIAGWPGGSLGHVNRRLERSFRLEGGFEPGPKGSSCGIDMELVIVDQALSRSADAFCTISYVGM